MVWEQTIAILAKIVYNVYHRRLLIKMGAFLTNFNHHGAITKLILLEIHKSRAVVNHFNNQ